MNFKKMSFLFLPGKKDGGSCKEKFLEDLKIRIEKEAAPPQPGGKKAPANFN